MISEIRNNGMYTTDIVDSEYYETYEDYLESGYLQQEQQYSYEDIDTNYDDDKEYLEFLISQEPQKE